MWSRGATSAIRAAIRTPAQARASSTGAIFRESVANKSGLSHALDGVMRSGAHDMKVFGAGTLRALASRGALTGFLAAHFHFYHAMETHLDSAIGITPSGDVWKQFEGDLRRAEALRGDLESLGAAPEAHPPTPGTGQYISAIATAAAREREEGAPPLLVAHFYTRYLADLFGGSMLGWPTKLALGLPEVPRFYVHGERVTSDRKRYVESVYEAINAAGAGLSPHDLLRMKEEATSAFGHNASVYKEGPGGGGAGMFAGAAVGGARVLAGHAAGALGGKSPRRDVFGKVVG